MGTGLRGLSTTSVWERYNTRVRKRGAPTSPLSSPSLTLNIKFSPEPVSFTQVVVVL